MAEIYALSETVRVARSVAWRLEELNVMVQYPLVVKVDNKQSKTIARVRTKCRKPLLDKL